MPKKKAKSDPVLSERPTVEIEGETYQIKPLGLRACMRVIRIFGHGISILVRQGRDFSNAQVDPATVLQVITSSLQRNEDDVLDLIAEMLGVERQVVEDPEKFPAPAMFDIYKALSEHEDILAFLERAQEMLDKMPDPETTTT